ncbi:hypothetical protein Dimus_011351, partial [Dionaea muscipula]
LGEVLPGRQRMKVNRVGLAMKTTEQDGRPTAELAEQDYNGDRAGRDENDDRETERAVVEDEDSDQAGRG